MKLRRIQSEGYLLIDAVVALFIFSLIIMGWMTLSKTTSRFNGIQMVRQRCIAAGQAQLDSYSAIGKSISKEKVSQLWPGIQTEITSFPGQGDWTGLTLVKVTSQGMYEEKQIQVTLARYVSLDSRRIP